MKPHSGASGRLATLKLLLQRFAILAMIMASLGLMLLGKADTALMERTRTTVDDAVMPMLDVLSQPASTIAKGVEFIQDLANLHAENARLKAENRALMHWQTVAHHLDNENRALRTQLNFIPDPDPAFITGRVIGDTGGAFVHSMLINAGEDDGVRKGLAVLSEGVLVGRIAEVGTRSARILLMTDINARIPVILEGSRAKAILAGDNSSRPRLDHFSPNLTAEPGDRVITSGDGGAFPPGIPVGVVASVHDSVIRIEPFVQRHRLEYVTIVDYGLAGILPAETPRNRAR